MYGFTLKGRNLMLRISMLYQGNTVRGKILEGENFGEFGEWQAIRQNFPCQYL